MVVIKSETLGETLGGMTSRPQEGRKSHNGGQESYVERALCGLALFRVQIGEDSANSASRARF